MSKYNSYIGDGYIDSAREIRKTYNNIIERASNYEKKLINFCENLETAANELESYKNRNFDGETDLAKLQLNVIGKITEIEQDIQNMNNLILPLNKELEKLQKDEWNLFELLTKKYPIKTSEELSSELEKFVD